MTCSVGSRKEVRSVGRVSSHRPVRSFFQFGNGEGKIILLFGYVGRYPTSLKEMRIPDHLTCLLRNLYAGQEVTELDIEQQTGSKSGKENVKVVYCHPAYLTYMQNANYVKCQAE